MALKDKSPIIDFGAVPLFVVLALIGLLIGSRWFLQPGNVMIDGAIITAIGFICLLRVKFSSLRRGTSTTDVDPTKSDLGLRDYKTAFALLCIGVILVLLASAIAEQVSP